MLNGFTDIININYEIVKSIILYKIYVTSYLKNQAFIQNTVGGLGGVSWERKGPGVPRQGPGAAPPWMYGGEAPEAVGVILCALFACISSLIHMSTNVLYIDNIMDAGSTRNYRIRYSYTVTRTPAFIHSVTMPEGCVLGSDEGCHLRSGVHPLGAVSYTHLTLPTKRIV